MSAQNAAPIGLIATLGPASIALVRPLISAGVTGFRLNASHLPPAELGAALRVVRNADPEIPVVVDLQGAKMRLGQFPERHLRPKDKVHFTLKPQGREDVPLPHPELFTAAAPGLTMSCHDGRLKFRVLTVGAGTIDAECLIGGPLRPRKGVNLEDHPVELVRLTDQDRTHIGIAIEHQPVEFAFSFMSDGREAAWVRDLAPASPVIGKIERSEALAAVASIDAAVDVSWVCRGDLGAQMGPVKLARLVNEFDPRRLNKPVFMAGQVLDHLTRHPGATRSEICHLYDLLVRGFAGFVLSDETAVGSDPVRAVQQAAALIKGFAQEIEADRG